MKYIINDDIMILVIKEILSMYIFLFHRVIDTATQVEIKETAPVGLNLLYVEISVASCFKSFWDMG